MVAMEVDYGFSSSAISVSKVLTIGAFDGVHLGHQALIRSVVNSAASHNLESTVMTFHPLPRQVLHGAERHLLSTLEERLELIAALGVDRVIVFTFALGGALAGAAGVLYALIFKQVHFFMGFFPGIKAFTAAVLGGIGNPVGAMIGGFFLGIFESLGPSLFLDGLGIVAPYQLKDVISFSMLVLVLIFAPAGILGEQLYVKKA